MNSMRNGPAADAGGGRSHARATTPRTDATIFGLGRLTSFGGPCLGLRVTSRPRRRSPPPLAITEGRTSAEGAAHPGSGGVLALTGPPMPPPPAHIPTHGVAPAASAREGDAQPDAAARAAAANAQVEAMLARQQGIVTAKRRMRGKTAADQARVVAKAQGRDAKDFVATIDADEGHSTPSPKRFRSSTAHTGEKDHPPPPFPGTGKHAAIVYKGFSICNSKSKLKWRVTPFCRPVYDKGFGYKTDPEAVWANVIEYCGNPTIPQSHWDQLSPENQAKFAVASAERPAPTVPSPATIAHIVGHRKRAKKGKGKTKRK